MNAPSLRVVSTNRYTLAVAMGVLEVIVSTHALDRYAQRVRPALTRDQASHDLERLIATHGHLDTQPPPWLRAAPGRAYLHLGDDVCLPLAGAPGGWVAVTTAVRGSMPHEARQARNAANASRRWARTHQPRREGPRPAPPAPTLEATA